MDSDEIRSVDDENNLDEVLALPKFLLYKHSSRCGTSVRAMAEVERFARSAPGIPVFGIDVVRQKALSVRTAEKLGVGHESPQVLLVERGSAVWHASHYRITAAAIAAALEPPVSD